MTEIVSVAEAADFLSVSSSTVRRLLAGGRLTAYRLPSGCLGVDLVEVTAKMLPIPPTWP